MMASDQGHAPDADVVAEGSPPSRPFHRDPLIIVGACVALAALVGFWYLFLRSQAAALGQEVARLSAMAGEVRLRPVRQGVWIRPHAAERLRVGDRVQTEPRAAAEITFDVGTVVHVRPDSVVHIGGSAKSSTAAWRIQSGRIHFAAGEQAAEFLTPTLRTTADAHAIGDIDVTASGATGVKVFEGRARIQTNRNQGITLQANEAVQVDSTGHAGAKLDLPPPPTLVAPLAHARIAAGEVATLVWTAVAEGASYRLAVDYNLAQANLLLAAPPTLDKAGITTTTVDLDVLDPGRYFWRVAAVSPSGLEGAFSRVSLFSVVERPAAAGESRSSAPALVLEPLQEVGAGIVVLAGRTDPGAGVTVNGVPVQVAKDGSFSEYIQSARGRRLVVRAARDGAVAETSVTVPGE